MADQHPDRIELRVLGQPLVFVRKSWAYVLEDTDVTDAVLISGRIETDPERDPGEAESWLGCIGFGYTGNGVHVHLCGVEIEPTPQKAIEAAAGKLFKQVEQVGVDFPIFIARWREPNPSASNASE